MGFSQRQLYSKRDLMLTFGQHFKGQGFIIKQLLRAKRVF
jgi:hypothetical protein